MIIIKNIKIPVNKTDSLESEISKIIGKKKFTFEIYKRSLDARKNLIYNYQVLVESSNEDKLVKKKNIEYFTKPKLNIDVVNPSNKKTIIVGAGPAGLFAAYLLTKEGVSVVVVERGYDVDKRQKDVKKFWNTGVLNEESNVQFGEGGAGTFSDGKLTSRSKDLRMELIKEIFVKYGAPEEILYESKPHVGTDVFMKVIKNMRNSIIKMGGEFHFGEKVKELIINNGKIQGVRTLKIEYLGNYVILAVGNSSRELFTYLEKTVAIESKPLAVGFRVEHSQDMINKIQYNSNVEFGKKNPASYMLTSKTSSGLGVYTFCMCPGGIVINASSERGHLAVNGMSYHSRREKMQTQQY